MIIDFHSHILPGADHGSDGLATSLAQLDLMRGVTDTAVATPHFYPERHRVGSFLERRDKAFAELSGASSSAPRVIPGAEVLVCEGLENMEGLDRLTVSGTRVILLEMPMSLWNVRLIETVENIKAGGLVPVMAHLDRYPESEAAKVLEVGVKIQLNASAFTGLFGRKRFFGYVDRGYVSALGSDLHGAERNGYRGFTKALSVLGSAADEIMKKTQLLLEE